MSSDEESVPNVESTEDTNARSDADAEQIHKSSRKRQKGIESDEEFSGGDVHSNC